MTRPKPIARLLHKVKNHAFPLFRSWPGPRAIEQPDKRIADLVQLCEDRLRAIGALGSEIAELRRSRSSLLDEVSALRSAAAPYRGPAIPVVLGVDVEPNARAVDLRDPSWDATTAFFSKTVDLRNRVRTISGAPLHITWFPRADPQVEISNGSADWALKHFEAEWRIAQLEGDEIGLHMHPWRWDEVTRGWCQDHGDEGWVLQCARSSIDAYRGAFGKTPAAYRGGDRFLSNAMVRLLEEEGVQLDLTLERMPGAARLVEAERGTGNIPDGENIPPSAYRPSSADFRVPDPDKTSGLGMLPLTAYEQETLAPWLPNIRFEEALDRLLAAAPENGLTHLAFVARSDLANIPQWEAYVDNVISLARRVREGRLVFKTASETWEYIGKSRSQPPFDESTTS
ncbi:hypothetical protein [Mesorhizobium sp. KR9-304]|uniref:hypothetical protein n=1 Tax=Mesorhizobium sp. KR9-304 TaxID=3156614 RepID=UPI0032B4F0B1